MIHLAGLTPGVDIEVRFTGLRPGEKLFEEISLDSESILTTHHPKIRIFKGPETESDVLSDWLDRIQLLIRQRDSVEIVNHFAALVPEYKPERRKEPRKPKVAETAAGFKREVVHPRLLKVVREEHSA
jgi:FlaA1/EpsC-like NDP-sugar epimerase